MNDLMNRALDTLNRAVRLKCYFHEQGDERMFSAYCLEEYGALNVMEAMGIRVKYKPGSLEYELA